MKCQKVKCIDFIIDKLVINVSIFFNSYVLVYLDLFKSKAEIIIQIV